MHLEALYDKVLSGFNQTCNPIHSTCAILLSPFVDLVTPKFMFKTRSESAPLLRRDSAPGFALIVALTLMGFVVLLILSLSVMVQTEVQLSGAHKSMSQARLNAMFALQEAVGQLQKYAGPDQRVTSTASIEDTFVRSNGATMEFTSVANPNFTLVWDVSGAEGQAPGSIPGHDPDRKPAVLVSGNATSAFDISSDDPYPAGYVTPNTALDPNSPDVVTLVDAVAPDGSGDTYRISVPRVDIGQNEGSYAWWVGDENVKARLNLDEEINTADHSDAAWLVPQHLSPQLNPVLDGLATSELGRVNFFNDLGISALPDLAGSNSVNYLGRDYSLVSNSLFVDVRNGGLKKDLSYGLDNANTAPAEIADANFLFSRGLGGAPEERSPNFNFIQWGLFRDFYNTRVATGDVVNTHPNRLPLVEGEPDYRIGIKPVITHFQLGIYADYDGLQIRFTYFPVIVLWNPYRFDIQTPDLHAYFKQDRGDNNIEIQNIEVEGRTVSDSTLEIGAIPLTIKSARIPAGRAMIFSPSGADTKYTPGTSSGIYVGKGTNGINLLEEGYRQGEGFEQLSGITFDDDPSALNPDGSKVVPRIRFTLTGNGRFFLDVSEQYLPTMSWSSTALYQVICGISASNQMGVQGVQFYEPLLNGHPDPKFLYTISMPFAETDFYASSQSSRVWAGLFNPRATVNTFNNIDFGLDKSDDPLANYIGGFSADSDAEANSLMQTVDGSYAYVGTSATFGGAGQAILFDLPQEAPHALAQFAHANLIAPPVKDNPITKSLMDTVDGNVRTGWTGEFMWSLRLSFTGAGDDYAPAYIVGSSRASPYIELDADNTSNGTRYWHFYDMNGGEAKMVWDYSYLVNEVLFDRYYFSTVPQTGTIAEPFRNPLVKPIAGIAGNETALRDFDESASELYLKGGFNVNSTSVDAWSAFLSAYRDQPYDTDTGTGSLFARFSGPVGSELSGSDLGQDEAGSVYGYRRLSDDEIRDLAERIVEQVKLRGPFPSMAAFVNRVMYSESLYRDDLSDDAPDPHNFRPSSYDLEEMVMRQGALSAALELAICNEDFYGNSDVVDTSSGLVGSTAERSGFYGAIGADLPGYLSQVDLLSVLGPAMTVRSDTFTILVYGSAEDPLTGETLAEAYGEAVVQRVPEFVDSTLNDPWDDLAALQAPNSTLGRKFKIVSFRWLGEGEMVQ